MFSLHCPNAGFRHPVFDTITNPDHFDHPGPKDFAQRAFNPRFDIHETDDAYHLDGELPGLTQKDIDIELSDPLTLVIKGRTEREYHRTEPENATDKADNDNTNVKKDAHRYWASERTVGEFRRTFSFPSHVKQDAVKASLKNGVLSIHVPKAIATVPKKITIQ
ncbi:HSP20-like chaperone [Penicillium malachiteum]|uniref:HSP20-like chaperone n=1 Tax=Penicillium malachiteum TaxID=1324776 RepID=UPI00254677FF|nr:HSP20-like chaperone [Penicillium malachiteum]KAJ5730462.1 HSP20-like chaperone [Penicillium malachiteum]